ncbi:MAG: histidine triad nucleotide-binding protein [Bacteroidota bacterium]
MTDCLFCRIVRGDAPASIVYRDEEVTAFRDIRPAGPTHILIVPNQHITSVNEIAPEDEHLVGRLFSIARQLAAQEGVAQSGYRILTNTGPDAGQAVFHLHFHLIGGQRMRFPMG